MRRRSTRGHRSGKRRVAIVVLGLALVGASVAQATHVIGSDTQGHTTLEQVLQADGTTGYQELSVRDLDPDETHVVRDGATEGNPAIPTAQPGRAQRRRSLAYFSQLTDFQLADEESPARVEFVDPGPSSAWRPQEALTAFQVDQTVRQVNAFKDDSPVPQGNGNRNEMDFSLMTGDQADNNQRNETIWVRELLEGGSPLNFNSGGPVTDPTLPGCASPNVPGADEAARYTGVQDYSDYNNAKNVAPLYYDPDQPAGQYADWPTYTGLMDRAQQLTITPVGLDVPWYLTNGNHDVLVQGNEDANREFERIAMGCQKVLASTSQPTAGSLDLDTLLTPSKTMLVPPDPLRRFVDKRQIKSVYGANNLDNDHGFGFVDPAEETASNGSASYYAWDPPQTPGFRFISVDTNSEGGQTAEGVACGSSDGNIDDPQFQWLKRELDAAQQAGKLIVLFGHHPVRSMCTEVIDEQAAPCTVNDQHGDVPEHDVNPGCDRDPRLSSPVHLGTDPVPGDPRESFVELLDKYPNVISYVAGHTHEHRLLPFTRSSGTPADPSDDTVWWEINTSAVIDWPTQSRLIEVMDNCDGTLSIFGTVIDHAAPGSAPPSGDASGFGNGQLASIGRTLTFNDPQGGPDGGGEGRGALDRNAELLVRDPRGASNCGADLSVGKSDNPDPAQVGQQLTYTVTVRNDGPLGASGVILSDSLPKATGFGSATASQGSCSRTKTAVNCNLGALASGATATVTIVVKPTRKGTINNTASVTAGSPSDPNQANNTDTENTTVLP
jgi:uncharacterized repeat protein (TIGR01451 family)